MAAITFIKSVPSKLMARAAAEVAEIDWTPAPSSINPAQHVVRFFNMAPGEEIVDLPAVKELIQWVKTQLAADYLGNVLLTVLPAGEGIKMHTNNSPYFQTVDRFHVPLLTDPEVLLLTPDGDSVHMEAGKLYRLNHVEHGMNNGSISDRIHLVVDILA